MDLENFLANIYFGSLDIARFHSFKDLEQDEKTRQIISRYSEVSEKYSPSLIEKMGAVPAELLEELRGIGFFGLNIPEEY